MPHGESGEATRLTVVAASPFITVVPFAVAVSFAVLGSATINRFRRRA